MVEVRQKKHYIKNAFQNYVQKNKKKRKIMDISQASALRKNQPCRPSRQKFLFYYKSKLN